MLLILSLLTVNALSLDQYPVGIRSWTQVGVRSELCDYFYGMPSKKYYNF